MKITEITQKLFDEIPLSIEYIESGLTNDNYHVMTHNHNVVIRLPRSENQGLFNYHCEQKALTLIQKTGLDTPLIYYDKESGIKCSTYIPNAEIYTTPYIKQAAQLIRKLHSRNLQIGIHFDLYTKFKMYEKATKSTLFNTTRAHKYLLEAAKLCDKNILCHNDLVQGNFLFTEKNSYLIDYEYAMDNDPFFDLISFLTENDIQDSKLREIFYEIYFDRQPTSLEIKKLILFEIAHHVLWCQWAMMMFGLHQKPIYHDIAELKYQRLMEFF